MPNETWQSDFTHYRLTRPDGRPGTDTEIITWLDDHSRYALHVTAHHRVTAPIVLATFRASRWPARHPASTLTDNGMVYTVRFAGPAARRPQRLRAELRRLRHRPEELPPQPPHHLRQGRTVPADHEEVAPRPTRPAGHHRRAPGPPRPLRRRVQPPPTAPLPPPPGHPGDRLHTHAPKPPRTGDRSTDTHDRVRHDRVDKAGTVTLRIDGRLRHIGVGRTHARTHVILLVQDLHVRIVNAATGELLRDLTIDPSRDYQPTGRPPGPQMTNSRTCDSQVRLSAMS